MRKATIAHQIEPPFSLVSSTTPKGCTLEEIKSALSQYGRLHGDGIRISTKKSDTRCFVDYATAKGALKARQVLNGTRCLDFDPTLKLNFQYTSETRMKLVALGLLDNATPRIVMPERMPPGPITKTKIEPYHSKPNDNNNLNLCNNSIVTSISKSVTLIPKGQSTLISSSPSVLSSSISPTTSHVLHKNEPMNVQSYDNGYEIVSTTTKLERCSFATRKPSIASLLHPSDFKSLKKLSPSPSSSIIPQKKQSELGSIEPTGANTLLLKSTIYTQSKQDNFSISSPELEIMSKNNNQQNVKTIIKNTGLLNLQDDNHNNYDCPNHNASFHIKNNDLISNDTIKKTFVSQVEVPLLASSSNMHKIKPMSQVSSSLKDTFMNLLKSTNAPLPIPSLEHNTLLLSENNTETPPLQTMDDSVDETHPSSINNDEDSLLKEQLESQQTGTEGHKVKLPLSQKQQETALCVISPTVPSTQTKNDAVLDVKPSSLIVSVTNKISTMSQHPPQNIITHDELILQKGQIQNTDGTLPELSTSGVANSFDDHDNCKNAGPAVKDKVQDELISTNSMLHARKKPSIQQQKQSLLFNNISTVEGNKINKEAFVPKISSLRRKRRLPSPLQQQHNSESSNNKNHIYCSSVGDLLGYSTKTDSVNQELTRQNTLGLKPLTVSESFDVTVKAQEGMAINSGLFTLQSEIKWNLLSPPLNAALIPIVPSAPLCIITPTLTGIPIKQLFFVETVPTSMRS